MPICNKISFAMGLHFHQPVGNFDEILERAYRNCYKPFLEVFSKYPDIKINFHFSGNLLDYFGEKYPEFLDKAARLVDSGRVEIMGGGYYEPVFQVIPKNDRLGQLRMMSEYCAERFGKDPRGMWLPERVWSPELASDIRACGMKYTVLDDWHLIKAGLDPDEIFNYFTTGDGDAKLAIFPSLKALRYSIPFKAPRKTISYLKKTARGRKNILFTYGDDAEKFGEWPWTYKLVYQKGWLDNFFKELTRNRDWLETVTFSGYMDSHPPKGNVSVPEASYEEMEGWSGGSWKNFLLKYPESNQMHKRMMYVSERISGTEKNNTDPEISKKILPARKELYKAQTNCAYWHGVFGGIYFYHLRSAIYEHLIKADNIIDGIQGSGLSVKEEDFYGNGENIIICGNKDFFMSIDPWRGGVIREIDYKPDSVNLINTLARRKEDYHDKVIDKLNNKKASGPLRFYEAMKSVDPRIRKGIFYDRYPRSFLVDHFIKEDITKESFENCDYADAGDFSIASYSVKLKDNGVVMEREGKVSGIPVFIRKEIYILPEKKIEARYSIINKGTDVLDTRFGTEINLTMPYADSERYSFKRENS
ncbi:MAG: DUF1926 domain-containing protein [Candidatus Omnitrophica bacterium]|nr:DUF1926 domain-containing protein [Candidatus Omnitrophota bacterium]